MVLYYGSVAQIMQIEAKRRLADETLEAITRNIGIACGMLHIQLIR